METGKSETNYTDYDVIFRVTLSYRLLQVLRSQISSCSHWTCLQFHCSKIRIETWWFNSSHYIRYLENLMELKQPKSHWGNGLRIRRSGTILKRRIESHRYHVICSWISTDSPKMSSSLRRTHQLCCSLFETSRWRTFSSLQSELQRVRSWWKWVQSLCVRSSHTMEKNVPRMLPSRIYVRMLWLWWNEVECSFQ